MQDLVCGLEVSEAEAAARSVVDGRTYYFDSQDCKRKFDQDPRLYIDRFAQATAGERKKAEKGR